MKPFFASLFICFLLLECGVCAFSAPQHSWLVVGTSAKPFQSDLRSSVTGHAGYSDEQLVALRDDSKIRRTLTPAPPPNDSRVFSPDGKHWLEVKYDSGFSVASSRQYLIVGAKGETDKNKKPFNDSYVESAQWTASNNILLASGSVDWSLGTQVFAYSIINPVTGKEAIDLKPFREGFKSLGGYERNGTFSPGESQFIYVSQSPSFGGEDYTTYIDHNDYLVCFDFKRGHSQVVCGFRAIGSPQWNPQGTRAVFSACSARSRDGNSAPSNIYVYSPENESLFQFTFSPFENSFPMWSPDGKRIAWISNRPLKAGGKADKRRLYTMNADGTNQKVFAPDVVNVTSVRWQTAAPQ